MEIEVNSKTIEARKGDTILESLTRNGIRVPTLCNIKGLSPTGACRICVVEVEGISNLVTACSYPVEPGMKIKTHSPKVLKARKILVELLLSSHPDDCLYCERNGTCELQDLAVELNIRERRIPARKQRHKLDLSSPSIIRDPAKCILCGRCVRICDEIQSVATLEHLNRGRHTFIGTTMNSDINSSSCINCGQCIMVCPTGALHEHSHVADIQDLLSNKDKKVAVQVAPAVSVSLAEEFNLKPGKDLNGILFAVLKTIGFDYVFDTSFAADLHIIETANMLNEQKSNNEKQPLISSCCPAWIKFAEQFYPDLLPLISTSKSPQQMMGALLKSYFTALQGIAPNQLYSVSIVPCVAKKFEAQRPEMSTRGVSDVDIVLTTRELVKLIRLFGIDIESIEPQHPDNPFGTRSTSGKLFANSGGITEGLVRTLYHMKTGKELNQVKLSELRSVNGIKEFTQKMGNEKLKVVVANGMSEIRPLLESIQNGECNADYIEIMACPGGCINGGGQPLRGTDKYVKARAKTIYDIDESESLKCAHNNPSIKELYNNYLNTEAGDRISKLLHVTYSKRDVLI
jgi:iron-only hydrogenase group A